MRILPVSTNQYYYNNNVKPVQKNSVSTNSISFSGNFGTVLENVMFKDLTNRAEVSQAIQDLYKAALQESGIKKSPYLNILSQWLLCKGTFLVDELCKPIAKISPEFRDIIFKSQEECLPLITKGDDDLLYIRNLGKQGFWNNIFERESARNDVAIIFCKNGNEFEIGQDTKGRLITEQSRESGYWIKNTFGFAFDRIAQKTGNLSDTIVYPF